MTSTSATPSPKVTFAAPERILVATDLTDSDYLIPYVVAQAKVSNSHVTLLHAIIPANSFPIEAGAIPYGDRESIDKDARALLFKMAHQIEAHGIVCDVDVQHGFASDVVREALADTGATQLIMGTHGRGKLGQFALGSVANELLKTVDVPIFAVGPRALTSPEHAAPRKILHPVSLDGECQKSVDFAIDVAQIYGAELTLLHVMSPDATRSNNSERTLNWAKNAMLALTPKGVTYVPPIQAVATCGHLVEEILSAANRTQSDWIILGVDGDYPLWSLKDSTAYKVLAAANCPVFAIRHDSKVSATAKAAHKEHVGEAKLADVSA
jgi:nucleotide-binding universal stress UspA family protein